MSARDIQRMDLSPTEADAQIKNLLVLIERRLGLMPEMADIKCKLGDSIFDPDQEDRVQKIAADIASSLQLSLPLVKSFVKKQMLAAKIIQREESAMKPTLPARMTESERNTLEARKGALRKEIGGLMEPMLKALKPLSESLHMSAIAERVDSLARESELQNSESTASGKRVAPACNTAKRIGT